MLGPIIATTDFAPRADRAIDRAIAIGRQTDRPSIVFHACETVPSTSPEDDRIEAKLREVLPADAEGVQLACSGGHVPQAIAEYAEEQQAELIVMGAARHNSIGDYFLGTCCDHVIRRTNTPVLVVKKRPQGPYRKIAVATDFSSSTRAAVDWAASFLPGVPIHLIHAFHVPYGAWNRADYVRSELEGFAKQQMDEFVGELPDEIASPVTPHIKDATTSAPVNGLVKEEGIDLVVLGSHGETGFRHATIGSQANAMLTSTTADTVITGPRVSS